MADEEKNLIEILEENTPMDMSKYINYVQSPKCGAIATFAGTTRDTFEGICSSARSTWALDSIAVAHKLGPVPVGETSVFIAVSSVHRADALDACKFMIDEVKASVPIWKKEVYSNGDVWKENSEFLERRGELGKVVGRGCCGEKVMVVEEREKKGCCSGKVKISDETIDS